MSKILPPSQIQPAEPYQVAHGGVLGSQHVPHVVCSGTACVPNAANTGLSLHVWSGELVWYILHSACEAGARARAYAMGSAWGHSRACITGSV